MDSRAMVWLVKFGVSIPILRERLWWVIKNTVIRMMPTTEEVPSVHCVSCTLDIFNCFFIFLTAFVWVVLICSNLYSVCGMLIAYTKQWPSLPVVRTMTAVFPSLYTASTRKTICTCTIYHLYENNYSKFALIHIFHRKKTYAI